MLQKANIIIFLIILVSCGNIASLPVGSLAKEQSDVAVEAPYPTYEIAIRPGEVRLLRFQRPGMSVQGELWCGSQKFLVQDQGQDLISFISESYFTEPEQKTCKWKTSSLTYRVANVTVLARNFPQEFLRVNPKTVELSPQDYERVKVEQQTLSIVYANSSNVLFFDLPFKRPLKSKITSHYGIQRVYNKVKKGQHLGVDFRARVGIPVPASNRGKVVLAQNLFFTGLTVILDHGLGIFSIYGHLSSIFVNVGDIVVPTTVLGKSGNTGRASGPHLHWGIKVGQHFIDGLQLIEMTEKELTHDRQNLSSNL